MRFVSFIVFNPNQGRRKMLNNSNSNRYPIFSLSFKLEFYYFHNYHMLLMYEFPL